MRSSPTGFQLAALTTAVACLSCDGPFSTLQPAGTSAAIIARLFWWMAGGALAIWLLVMFLSLWAIRSPQIPAEKTRLLLIGGGTVVPFLLLTTLLGFGLSEMPALVNKGSPEEPHIRITGEQYWWRVQYVLPDGRSFETANEVWLPLGRRISFYLESKDVVHSFWIPALGGKVDMIPGRTTHLALEPTRTGVFGGWCAEYCGLSHARMRFVARVVEPEAFTSWVEQQLQPSPPSRDAGTHLFVSTGCGACHTVRGTPADGLIGPDLTHVGSREAVGAGILPNESQGFAEFLTHVSHLKPESQMPTFDMLPASDIRLLAEYLEERK